MPEESKIVPLSEVRKMLEGEEKAREMSYEQRLALEHARHFSNTEPAPDGKLVKKLMGIERINEGLAVKIVEINPKTENEVRAIFSKERFSLEPEEIQEILKVLSEGS
jgi:DNA-directed RNA polymerase subunit F